MKIFALILIKPCKICHRFPRNIEVKIIEPIFSDILVNEKQNSKKFKKNFFKFLKNFKVPQDSDIINIAIFEIHKCDKILYQSLKFCRKELSKTSVLCLLSERFSMISLA